MDVTSFILGFKKGAASGSGGGSVEGVHTVTFMSEDGSAVLYERPVADGDDCANVVDRGLLAAPTKASTAQYNYTYSGWSQTKGGSANASALKSVTADRTVYAAFTSAVRYYTITYLDSDGSVLKTESWAYGSTPSYKPTKDEYDFVAWTPTLVAVTGDASYNATWKEKQKFETMSWNEIIAVADAGNAATTFNIGDSRTFNFTDSYGINRYSKAIIVGFNHDDLADGTGKASMSIMLKRGFYASGRYYTGAISFEKGQTWVTGSLRTQIQGCLNNLPEELQSAIKPVKKKYVDGTSAKNIYTVTDTLWAPGLKEVYANSAYADDGERYAYFVNAGSAKLDTSYYLRYQMSYNGYWFVIKTDGTQSTATSSTGGGDIVFGFCI